MKQQFKNFITAIVLILSISFCVQSCTVSQNLGNSGVKITAGADVIHEPKTAYACIVADIDKLSTQARNWLFTKFPKIREQYNQQKFNH